MTLKEEFHSKFKYTQYDHPNLAEVWEWVEDKLKEEYARGEVENAQWIYEQAIDKAIKIVGIYAKDVGTLIYRLNKLKENKNC